MQTNQSAGLAAFVRGKTFANLILTVVLLNAVVIGLQSYPEVEVAYSSWLRGLDLLFLAIFTVEIVLKIAVYRTGFFKDGWNLFDFAVVAASLILVGSQFVIVLRILRVLRVLKTISSIPTLRRIITALFMAVPTIGNIAFLMLIVFFIYGVAGTAFFSELSPQFFGDLSKSLITLFQISTFDSWTSIYRPIAEQAPWSLVYFVTFIFVAVFVMLNLVVGEIVNNAAKLREGVEEIGQDVQDIKADASEIAQLRQEVAELKQLLVEEKNRRMDEAI
ncbi:ion transporter [Paenibacillaceae bacterium WGS1546]|uniref:ion transporter n=1 Tax=Cohnella sp. WGS1546 TaxID=3366810 RepID=UPI00372D7A16